MSSTVTGRGFPGLGVVYVATSLRAAGHTIELLDGKLGDLTTEDIVTRVHADRPDLVGITCMTVEYPRAVEIARRIKHIARTFRSSSAART